MEHKFQGDVYNISFVSLSFAKIALAVVDFISSNHLHQNACDKDKACTLYGSHWTYSISFTFICLLTDLKIESFQIIWQNIIKNHSDM